MKNLFISDLNLKNTEEFTSDLGLFIRRISDKPFKKACNLFTNANIIRCKDEHLSDDEYFMNLEKDFIPHESYPIKKGKNNIVVERYPELNKDEPYIFVCNHTCPEDIETVLNVIDRNAYLVLGSVESLKYNPEMYLSWLNGMIPFDIMDKKERHELMDKMGRVLKTNSILIFPEGSHNYSPNKLINNLYTGPVNLSLRTGRKIVPVTLIRDKENNMSYMDVGNPIDLEKLGIKPDNNLDPSIRIKDYVNRLTNIIRDKMATAVFHIMNRHFPVIERKENDHLEDTLRDKLVSEAFDGLKWDHDVFDAEYLTRKTKEEKEYEEVNHTLANLVLNKETLNNTLLDSRDYVLKDMDVSRKDVPTCMRNYWINQNNKAKEKKLVK